MTRRSLRIQEKKVASDEVPDKDGLREYEEEEHDTKSSRKRAKTNANTSTKKGRIPAQFRKVRGRLGLLERLAKDVPLDVILEIFCYLSPGDLLQLARSSKDLRGILMSKSSESIWRIARENVRDLPPRPEDLNEPQFAHLLYESYCHVCDQKGRCDNVLWSFRMRCCKNCLSTFHLFNMKFLESQPPEFRSHSDILPVECIPEDYQQIVHTGLVAQLKEEFETIPVGDRGAWFAQKKAERTSIVAHSKLCQIWIKRKLSERARELDNIREQRKEVILNRLAAIGWSEEAKIIMSGWKAFLDRDEFSDHKLVKQSKKLTEYGWNRIKDDLIQMLSDCKAKRLSAKGPQNPIIYQRYVDLMKGYKRILSESDLREPFPPVGDIVTHKVFEDLIWDTPHDEYLGDDFFRLKISEYLPGVINEWRPAKMQVLVGMMRNATASDLHLATSVFNCTRCAMDLHYPQMFYHHCCCYANHSQANERFQTYQSAIPFNGPWVSSTLTFNEVKSQTSRAIISSCFLDPATTTLQDMYSANPLIECTSCSLHGRVFGRWPLLFTYKHRNHTFRINSINKETPCILASEPDCEGRYDMVILCCAHCNKSLAIRDLLNHLEDVHKIYISINKQASRASTIEAAQSTDETYSFPNCTGLAAWEEFWHKSGLDMRKAGVAVRDRRYILWCMAKFRHGTPVEEFAHEAKKPKTMGALGTKRETYTFEEAEEPEGQVQG
ncbi:hypothetical protein BT96DRAFT_1015383 [Gymnopus androsaceus JB14]|uniref:F-box domain-containing protein n=1 Tax=Gymnopus androsaceus JB14 TaxID=1447944 RepID=A0A6A4I9A2_9AGAR|nr:hypothetical protein BT96DRAFT_1015383 [Gymnopus androsaceus JB14]